jgi:hypothetical protein
MIGREVYFFCYLPVCHFIQASQNHQLFLLLCALIVLINFLEEGCGEHKRASLPGCQQIALNSGAAQALGELVCRVYFQRSKIFQRLHLSSISLFGPISKGTFGPI